ncbi:MAG: hypothetical protein K9H16_04155 [Bacteroidales bacterium]|nr:hypothetical protein [Bacteroidales bacterium]
MKRIITIKLLILSLVLILPPQFYSCKKIDIRREVLLQTLPAESITFHSAVLKGTIVDAGEDGSIKEYGFVYGTVTNPGVADSKAIEGNSSPQVGAIGTVVDGIESNTTYYFKTYTIEEDGKLTYGNVNSFKTLPNPDATVPDVGTLQVLEISPIGAKVRGVVVDDGGASVTRRGFCISTNPLPNINEDPFTENGMGTGEFLHVFNNLTPNTEYYVRAYAENQLGVGYGGQLVFITQEGGGLITAWLFYDDGVNVDGIGLNEGGSFDVAIRFTPDQLEQYNGFKITKIKFFPKIGSPVEYFLEIFTGDNPTLEDQVYDQWVENPDIDMWNDVSLEIPHVIDASQELWVGYFITNQEALTYPAGIDNGPGQIGYGDLISIDDLSSWVTLHDADLDANWNIQVFVTNESGLEMPMTRTLIRQPVRKPRDSQSIQTISSKNNSR